MQLTGIQIILNP